jgi:hypothetical protein
LIQKNGLGDHNGLNAPGITREIAWRKIKKNYPDYYDLTRDSGWNERETTESAQRKLGERVSEAIASQVRQAADGLSTDVEKAIMSAKVETGGDGVEDYHIQVIGKLDKALYSVVSDSITTDEVVLTDEQRRHIIANHPDGADRVFQAIGQAVEYPDYILQDDAYATAVILKEVTEVTRNEEKMRVILRLATAQDKTGLKNSVITAFAISAKKWRRYLRNKRVIYKRDGI